ncbi:NADH-ubiquinone oxidoreductase B18 subunit [Raphidocelis subcapitata]|uniref:NADH dehydrogenase [ubiquinone] 1 beta subcomplex subunit 7 n=1 Tax=Raphidocelis subcapitata TaxID=307507 RepID=A0A2V0PBT9_9CHLO|nr:NADH-ubiquinone oxidoreductase B18 subunit [Raphidocelis subcapitata]|eukprot:GBF97331.1 NADH-ubiquinone oxidoreductase B18 subunit [Raphidocelis subcapitata]
MADKFPPPPMKATKDEMDAARMPYAWRDYCAHLLIPLNECRSTHYYMPWACGHERHVYEKCQYKEFKRRVAIMAEEKRRRRDQLIGVAA